MIKVISELIDFGKLLYYTAIGLDVDEAQEKIDKER